MFSNYYFSQYLVKYSLMSVKLTLLGSEYYEKLLFGYQFLRGECHRLQTA